MRLGRRSRYRSLLGTDDPHVGAAVTAVRAGDVEELAQHLSVRPDLAGAAIGGCGTARTLLHVATDWPGHHPQGAAVVRCLVDAGADVNARCGGPSGETPLHWAVASGDLEVIDALIACGADVEAEARSPSGGETPLAHATALGQREAARRLVEHGASITLREADAIASEVQFELAPHDRRRALGRRPRRTVRST